MALTNPRFKTKLVSKKKRTGWEKERRRGGGREEKMEEPRSSQQGMKLWIFVWKLTLVMNSMIFGMELWVCMMINLLKPRVLLGFLLNPKIMESKVGKIPYGTRWLWNSPFRLDSWLNDK